MRAWPAGGREGEGGQGLACGRREGEGGQGQAPGLLGSESKCRGRNV